MREEWSARRIEQYIVDLKRLDKKPVKKAMPQVVPRYESAVKRIEQRMSAPIQIRSNTKGAGKMVIRFKNDDDFQRITKLLG